MLYFPKTRVAISHELPIAVGASVQAEGLALVTDNTGGVFGLKPSTGTAADVFYGISISQEFPLLAYPKIEERVQPVANTIVLNRTPISGQLVVYDVTAAAVVPAGAGGWTLSGKTLTLQAGTAGHTIRVTYKFVPTAVEARAIQGDIYPGGAAGTSISQVGVLKSGAIYTTEFDASIDWSAAANATAIKTGANGQLTVGGSGTAVPAVVIQVPNTASPFLGIELSAA